MNSAIARSFLALTLAGCAVASVFAADPVVPSGYMIEPYLTGLTNPTGLAFSPGGGFGYDGQMFVAEAMPDSGTIYRVPSQGTKVHFADACDNEPHTLEFAPPGSAFGDRLFVTNLYTIQSYDSAGTRTQFVDLNEKEASDLAFGPGGPWSRNLFQVDSWGPLNYGESIREWQPDGTMGVLVQNLPENLCGLEFGPGGPWGTDLYLSFGAWPGIHGGIRRCTPGGVVSDVVLSSVFSGRMLSLAFDRSGLFNGNLFATDLQNGTVYEVDPAGNFSAFVTGLDFVGGLPHYIYGGDLVFGPDGAMYVADSGVGTVWRIRPVTPVDIDIKPGSMPNSVNLASKGVVPVAILGSDSFDVHDVDQESLELAGSKPKEKGKSGKIGAFEDVNGDMILDLILQFLTPDIELDPDATEAVLTGLLKDGTAITGSDAVRIVKSAINGDCNLDGVVNVGDLGILGANYGHNFRSWTEGDLNGDGVVNVADLGILGANCETGGAPAAVPEPATLILLCGAAAGLVLKRRRTK